MSGVARKLTTFPRWNPPIEMPTACSSVPFEFLVYKLLIFKLGIRQTFDALSMCFLAYKVMPKKSNCLLSNF